MLHFYLYYVCNITPIRLLGQKVLGMEDSTRGTLFTVSVHGRWRALPVQVLVANGDLLLTATYMEGMKGHGTRPPEADLLIRYPSSSTYSHGTQGLGITIVNWSYLARDLCR